MPGFFVGVGGRDEVADPGGEGGVGCEEGGGVPEGRGVGCDVGG